VWELRESIGDPATAFTHALEGKRVVLLCDGGDKRSQTADIERAIDHWNEWQTGEN
jgi:putative component of toxin-antitoxin plasmid stabilization module